MRVSTEERFWSCAAIAGPDDCWPWTSALNVRSGRPMVWMDGRNRNASRVAFELGTGLHLVVGIAVRLTCGTKTCVNPNHMELEPHRGSALSGFPLERRFWLQVDRRGPDECWPWTGGLSGGGYGALRTPSGSRYAHRFSLEMHLGRGIRDGLFACHKCDNRRCVNPHHLFEGTALENTRDAAAKGRLWWSGAKGERNRAAKLSASQVLEILRRTEAGEKSGDLAREFGVKRWTIKGIRQGRVWGHVTGRTLVTHEEAR